MLMTSTELNLLDVLIVLAMHKVKIIVHFVVVAVAAVVFSCFMTKYYRAQVVFVPQGPSGVSVTSILQGGFGGDILGSVKLSKRQYVTLLESRELREELIKKFDLVKLYENSSLPNPIDKTLMDLRKTLPVSIEEEGGLGMTNIISITVSAIDKDPIRASDMANYAFELLNRKVNELNSSEHQAVIDFLDRRMALCNEKLADARKRKKEFQLANHAYHVPQQVGMVLQAIGTQKAEVLALESQKEYMTATRTQDYEGLKTIEQKIASINAKIREMEQGGKNDIFPGLTRSVDLADEYADAIKDVETYLKLGVLLTEQKEQAELRKNKNFSGIYIIDKARPPQYKFKPKRARVVLVITGLYMSVLLIVLLIVEHFRRMRETDPQKLVKFDELFSSLASFKKR
jgi:uncharacterized protein involved in exopolysaccharide biosynthesis